MKKIISFITIAFLTGFTGFNGMNVLAGGCNTHMNKNAKTECTEDDVQCQKTSAEKYKLEKTVQTSYTLLDEWTIESDLQNKVLQTTLNRVSS